MFGTWYNSTGTWYKSAFVLGLCILICGCNGSDSLGESFADASPRIKQTWEQAVKLDAADKYMSAAETYDSLFAMGLTPRQKRDVESAISRMYGRVRDQAAAGDPDAKRIVEMNERSQAIRK